MIALQMEGASTKLLDYGLAGIGLLVLGTLVWYLYKKQEKYAEDWKSQSEKMSDNFITLVTEQNKTNQRLIDIREKDVLQNKEFYNELKRDIEDIPRRTIRELSYKALNDLKGNNNNTSAG